MNEIWKKIEQYPIYEVSNLGKVRSIERRDSLGRLKKSKILSLNFNRNYLSVALCKRIDDRTVSKTFLVHRLVAEAFITKIVDKPYVNHIDGIKSHNYVDNLEWVNASENMNHAIHVLHKNTHFGENHHNAKLNKKSAMMIRDLYSNNKYSQHDLALAFHVDAATIYSIVHNETWK